MLQFCTGDISKVYDRLLSNHEQYMKRNLNLGEIAPGTKAPLLSNLLRDILREGEVETDPSHHPGEFPKNLYDQGIMMNVRSVNNQHMI
jgi:hypothetical protein